MQKYISILKRTKLFSGVGEDDLLAMLHCLGAECHSYKKGTYVFRQGEHIRHIMILAEGDLLIQRDDYWGNRSIISHIAAGDMFGEAYATPDSGALLNDVVVMEDSTVIFFDIQKILTVCPSGCRFHALTIQNLFFAISDKNRQLVQKMGHMAKRTTREKLLSYLSDEAKRQNSSAIIIPFNRQQLADFLAVDRSAMSSELSKMKAEGLISYNKNYFVLKD